MNSLNSGAPRNGAFSFQEIPVPQWKRALDIFCILLSLPLLVPLGLLIAAIIKVVSPGPVLFKQERVGIGASRFMCLKFRTMKVNADTKVHQGHLNTLIKSNGPMQKLDVKGDPRLIRFGLALRSLGIDELPQLINVLRGEMSLVGPRPCIPYEFEHFPPEYQRRCETLPGLTGLWQVSGKNRLSFEQMMDLDLRYIREKTLWLDLCILFRTPLAIAIQAWDVKVKRALAKACRPETAASAPVLAERPRFFGKHGQVF